MKITANMEQALMEARASGVVHAGKSVDWRGRTSRHAASTLRALAQRGLLSLAISPDGGMMGRLTEDGTSTVTLLASGNGLLRSLAGACGGFGDAR
jgi:hypothetical protein